MFTPNIYVMKNLTLILLAFVVSTTFAQNTKEVQKENGPKIEFRSDVFDYGNIEANSGHDGMAEFVFVNTGTEPLVLSSVKAGCGCTSPFWQKEPVLPGDTGKVVLKYTTIQHPHTINKSAVVYSNAVNAPSAVVRITGTVVPKPDNMWPEKNVDKSATPFAQ